MKRIYSYVFAAVAMFAAVSCQKENAFDAPEVNEEAFAITAVANADTKTVLDGLKTYWTPTDALTAFDAKGANRKFTTDITENSASARFTTPTFTLPENIESGKLLAVYPYTEGAKTDFQTKVSGLEIPVTQQAVVAGFDPDAAISYVLDGVANQYSLKFNNVYGLFEFTVKNDGVKKVTVKANGGEKIAGPVDLYLNGTLAPASGAVSEVTLEGDFVSGSTYYVALIPGTYASGITVSFDGEEVKSTNKSITLKKNEIRGMGDLRLVYLVPNAKWKEANARFAAYFFGKKEVWVDMKDANGDGIYACEYPTDNTTAIFCRMNPNNAENKWDNRWAQTGNMQLGVDSYCVIPFDVWDGAKVWSSTGTYETTGYLHLAPNSDWFTKDNNKDPWFAAYFYGNGEKWVKMEEFSSNPKYYRVSIPQGFPNVIFVRMKPDETTLGWGSKNNQTADLTVKSGYFYEITGWDNSGKWVSK